MANGQSVEGVAVSTSGQSATTGADGQFELKVANKGDYVVSFAKDGYVPVTAEATIGTSASNRSSTVIKQYLIPRNTPFSISPDKDQVVGYDDAGISLSIPAGAVTETTDISITPFIPGARKLTDGPIYAGLITMSLEPDGFKFAKPIEIAQKDFTGGAVNFGTLKHIEDESNVRVLLENVAYVPVSQSYKTPLSGFSTHILAVEINTTAGGTATESLGTKTIDNLGVSTSKQESIAIPKKYGWTFDGDLASLIRAEYPSLTTPAAVGLFAHISTAINSLMGSAPGVGDITVTESFRVSGDVSLSLEILAVVEKYTFTFPLTFANGSTDQFSVAVTKYTGTQLKPTYTYGSTHTDHSGGGGQ